MSEQVDPAALSGLAEVPDTQQPPEVREVDTSGPLAEEGDLPGEATVHHLPVRQDQVAAHAQLGTLVPVTEELRGIASLAVTLAMAGTLPKALREKPADVLSVILVGRELGVAPMTAIRTFHVIDGTVTVAPKVRAAMVRSQGLGKLWPHQAPQQVPCPMVESESHGEDCRGCDGTGFIDVLCRCGSPHAGNDDVSCTWHAERADQPGVVFSSTYTTSMAGSVMFDKWEGPYGNRRKTGQTSLLDKDNWKNYPDRMLSWRALGYLLDDAFPEVGTGLYSPDEMGAVTDEDGQPILDVNEVDPLVGRISGQKPRQGRSQPTGENPDDAPASPESVAKFRARIEALGAWPGATDALKDLWVERNEAGEYRLPPLDNLLQRHVKVASALIDSIERRAQKGEFGKATEAQEADEAAPSGESAAPGAAEGVETAEGNHEAAPEEAKADAPEESDLSDLPTGNSHADDLKWVERAPVEMVDEAIAFVKALEEEEVVSRLQAGKIRPPASDAARRERLTAHVIRGRLERL